ncbi:SLAM family member 9-like isoform X2 [Mustelus asterias]
MLKQSFLTNILIIWFLLALLNDLNGLGQVDGNSVLHLVNGTLGQSLMLSLHLPWADPSIVTWDFRNSSTGSKIQVCMKVQNSPTDCNNELGQRINLNLTDYSLEIQTLMKSDQGFYEVNARSGQKVYEKIIELRVYERVSNLSIQIKDVSSNGICNVSLSCSVENNSNLKYSWWRGSEVVTTSGSHSVTDNGTTLEVSLDRHKAKAVYNCMVKNPVSEETGSIDLAGPCNITEKDHKLQNKTQLHIGIAVAVITISIVILIATLFVWRKKHSKPNEGSVLMSLIIIQHSSTLHKLQASRLEERRIKGTVLDHKTIRHRSGSKDCKQERLACAGE